MLLFAPKRLGTAAEKVDVPLRYSVVAAFVSVMTVFIHIVVCCVVASGFKTYP